jgi:hypothetical protein
MSTRISLDHDHPAGSVGVTLLREAVTIQLEALVGSKRGAIRPSGAQPRSTRRPDLPRCGAILVAGMKGERKIRDLLVEVIDTGDGWCINVRLAETKEKLSSSAPFLTNGARRALRGRCFLLTFSSTGMPQMT